MDKLNWRELNETLPNLTEQQVSQMLEEEKSGPRRPTTLIRLHQRFTTLRATRERDELLRLSEPKRRQPE